jgi:hypothetical protein
MEKALSEIDVQQILVESVLENKQDFLDLQRQQLMDGARNDDAYIFNLKTGKYFYSPNYAKYKGKDSPIDLHDTGAFYAGLDIEDAGNGDLNVFSNDEKDELLTQTYGEQIFGLGSIAREQFLLDTQPIIIQNLTEQINQ